MRRFADAVGLDGHDTVLFGSSQWTGAAWKGDLITVEGTTPRHFADHLQKVNPRDHCDFLFSLERVWECDAYRAGDGVHRAWLERRKPFEPAWKSWFRASQPKHREILELERALFSSTALIVANSHLVASEISQYFRVPESRLKVIYNGLPPSSFHSLPSSFQPGVVLFAGSGWERKGLRFAIEAVNHTTNAILLVAGAGKNAGLPASSRTQFLGEVTGLRDIMAAANIFLLPTIYDPFSNACLEAMAVGLPVITTTTNGFSEVMRPNEDGEILQNPADTAAIAAAIEKWAARETRATREARRVEARRFTIEENVRQTLALIENRESPRIIR